MEIDGRVAIVTGAGSGIGRATALALAREGASVVVADVDEAGAEETLSLMRAAGGEGATIRTDVTDGSQVDAMVAFAEATFGGLDIMHSNAGIIVPARRFDETDRGAWMRMAAINFTGVLLCAHAAIPALRRRGGGAIVNTSSIAGVIAYPGNPVYAATKAGVLGFTRALYPLHQEANIRVNCICPERVDTPLLTAAMRQAGAAAAASSSAPAVPLITAETVADVVLDIIRDDSMAGAAIKISPNMPPERLEFPDFGVVRT